MIFITPLRELYFHGPWINGWGFWAGKDVEEICAYLNPTTSQMHWIRNIDDCNELVQRHFNTFLIGVKFVVYIVFLYKGFMALLMLFHGGLVKSYCVLYDRLHARGNPINDHQAIEITPRVIGGNFIGGPTRPRRSLRQSNT